jgi:hypothetical protein
MSELNNGRVFPNSGKPLDTEKKVPLLSDFQPKSLLEAVRILLNHMSASDRAAPEEKGHPGGGSPPEDRGDRETDRAR